MNKNITFNDIPLVLLELGEKMDFMLESIRLSNNKPEVDATLDVTAASEILMVSKPTLYRYCSERKIKFYKRAKKLYFLKSDLMRFIMDGKKSTVAEIKNEVSHSTNKSNQK